MTYVPPYRPFSRVIIRTCAETSSARETTPLGGIAECGMSDYYKKLDSIAKARYLEKLKLLGLDEKDGPYDPITLWMTRLDGQLLSTVTSAIMSPTRSLYKAAIATMEKLRCFQLFSGWSCEDLASLHYLQLLHCDGICKPKPKCTRKITLHGLALNWIERLLLYTAPVWLDKYLFKIS